MCSFVLSFVVPVTSRWLLTKGPIKGTPIQQCQALLPGEAAAAFSQLTVTRARARAFRILPTPRTHLGRPQLTNVRCLLLLCTFLPTFAGPAGRPRVREPPGFPILHPYTPCKAPPFLLNNGSPSSDAHRRARWCRRWASVHVASPRSRPGLPAPLTQDAGDPQGQLLQVRLAGARGLGRGRGRGRRLLHGSRARSARGPGSRGAGAGERGAPQGRAPPPRLGHRVHGMPGVVVLGAEAAAAAKGGPGCPAKRSSAGRSFPRARLELHSNPPGLGDASARTLPPRRGRPRRRGRASAPSGQWGRRLASGAGRPRPDARSGGCFKMADAARPSRPGAAAFWSRDCILYPPGRGRRRPPGAGTRPGAVAWDSAVGEARRSPRGRGRAVQAPGFSPGWGSRWHCARSCGQAGVPGVGLNTDVSRPCLAVSSGTMACSRALPGAGRTQPSVTSGQLCLASLWRREGCWVTRGPFCRVLALSLVSAVEEDVRVLLDSRPVSDD